MVYINYLTEKYNKPRRASVISLILELCMHMHLQELKIRKFLIIKLTTINCSPQLSLLSICEFNRDDRHKSILKFIPIISLATDVA